MIKICLDEFKKYLDKKIKCTDSDDFVADKNLELISFILEDLDKCGEYFSRKIDV